MGLSKSQRLTVVIYISTSFFLAELAVGLYTKSLALIADAFHYLNDVIGFIVALTALKISQRPTSPDSLSFGWQRAELLGAFFNGVFLLALGVSIFLQSVDRFISLQNHRLKFVLGVKDPKLMLIIGCVGLASNMISAGLIHGTPLVFLHVTRLIDIKITLTMVTTMVMALEILLLRQTSSNRAPKHCVLIPSPHRNRTFPSATKVISIRFNSHLVDLVNEMLLH
ncbi:cation diffusion facilitator family metal ion transporter protein [Rutstroemia sp. NJR-2017a BBW]|nr:cation diffusion facilitator family metal ion transporter protein [Rutstroemia sp. NJR-2017a BBW]